MAARQIIGGLLAGLGTGAAQAGQMVGLAARQAALEEIRAERMAARDKSQAAAKLEAEGRKAGRDKELAEIKARQTRELEEFKAGKREDLERTRASLRPAKAGKADKGKWSTVTDKDGKPLYQENSATGERKAAPGGPKATTQAADRSVRDAKIALETAKELHTDDETMETDWAGVADDLEAKGFAVEAAAARKKIKVSEAAQPEQPGLMSRLASGVQNLLGGEEPAAPAPGGATALAGDMPAPKSESEYNALPSGARYRHPDGTVRTKP